MNEYNILVGIQVLHVVYLRICKGEYNLCNCFTERMYAYPKWLKLRLAIANFRNDGTLSVLRQRLEIWFRSFNLNSELQ